MRINSRDLLMGERMKRAGLKYMSNVGRWIVRNGWLRLNRGIDNWWRRGFGKE